MKRLVALMLSVCLLAGCGGGSASASSGTEAAPQPAPTAAPQTLTVCAATGSDTAAVRAVEGYAQAQGVTLEYTDDAQSAGLVLLPAAPAQDGGWLDFGSDDLLTAAASRAGLDGQEGVTALPIGRSLYGYWADRAMLEELLGGDAVSDLQAASWSEWRDLAQTVTGWIATPTAARVTLNGHAYTLPAQKSDRTAALSGVFETPDPANSAAGTENTAALYTGVLLAAGQTRSAATLTGPLNGLFSALALERVYQVKAEGQALFRRGFLADLAAGMDEDAAARLVSLPLKCDFVQEDLSTDEYNLTGLMNYPVFAAPAWLAIPASASAEQAKAGAAAILWLYTSEAGEQVLSGDLLLVTPWGTASDATAPAAMQIAQVGTGILPGVTLDSATAQALADAGAALYYLEDGTARTDWGKPARQAWLQDVIAVLDNTNAQP